MKDQLVKEFIEIWNVGYESTEQKLEFAAQMEADINEIVTALTTPVDAQEVERLAEKEYPIISEDEWNSRVGNLNDDYLGYTNTMIDCQVAFIKGYTAAQQPSQWEKALVSLTPGGSEFAGDPERCVEWVRENTNYVEGMLKEYIKDSKESQWVEIKSEKDLPITRGSNDVWTICADGNMCVADTKLLSDNHIRKYWLQEVTHYLPITKPAPPISKP